MKKIVKFIIIALLIVLLSGVALAGCDKVDKNSREYRFDIERFVGDYYQDPYMIVYVFDMDNSKNDYECNFVKDYDYEGFWKYESDIKEWVYYTHDLCKEAVDHINAVQDLMGFNVTIAKDKVKFNDSGKEYGFTSHYGEYVIKTGSLSLILEQESFFDFYINMFYEGDDKVLFATCFDDFTAEDGTNYRLRVDLFLNSFMGRGELL